MADLTSEEKVEVLRRALALYLECDEADLGNFVFGVERQMGEGIVFSGGWSAIPHWQLVGLVNELEVMVNNQRQVGVAASPLTATPDELGKLLGRP